MNQKDRNRLARVVEILSRVPFPHSGDGRSTASIEGMATFQRDMRTVLPDLREAIMHIARDDADWTEPDYLLDELESFVAKRAAEDWS